MKKERREKANLEKEDKNPTLIKQHIMHAGGTSVPCAATVVNCQIVGVLSPNKMSPYILPVLR